MASNWNQQPQAPPGYPAVGGGPYGGGGGGPSGSAGWAGGPPPPGPPPPGPPGADGGKAAAFGVQRPQQPQAPQAAYATGGGGGSFKGFLPMAMPMRPPVGDPESQQMASDMAFATVGMRNAFVRKVFGIVSLQLIFTAGVAAACIFVPEIKATVKANPGMFYAAWGVAFAMVLVISCVEKARRQFPLNVCLLGLFTLAQAWLVGMITAFYDEQTVLIAFIVTAAAVVGLTLFAVNTKFDATKYGSLLFVGLIIVIALSVIGIFWRTRILYLAISGIAALLFSAYLVYDIQAIMGGKRAEYSPDDYVAASMAIYLDIINLFIALLQIIGLARN